MRQAQARLRGFITMAAVALFVAIASVSAVPIQHAAGHVGRTAAQQAPIQRLPPAGRRWF